jgi:DNA-binding GntR family transcriptional regulator
MRKAMTEPAAQIVQMDRTVVAKATLASAAYLQLRREIINGDLLPGSKLKTRDLAERLDVGLTPIREALSRLSSEGLVRQLDQRGFSVAPIDEAGLIDLTRARAWMNELGLRKSIENGGREWEEGVLIAHHRLSRVPRPLEDTPTRTPEWDAAHMAFHRALIAGSGSDWLTTVCDQVFEAVARYRQVSRIGRTRELIDAEHKAITEAAISRDADLAVGLLTKHIEMTAELGREAMARLTGR